ncbi:MAG: hypothetical protein CMH52_13125 [Myxococcales bacterium]|nr:hypothetical protein [Myxococcales bacterium]
MKYSSTRLSSFAFSTAVVLLSVWPCFANPFYIGRFDGLRSGALNQSAFSTYWNPAGLTKQDTRLNLHVLGVNRRALFDRYAEENNVPDEFAEANSGENTTGAFGLVPSAAVAHGLSLGDLELGVGLVWFIDRAGKTKWKKNLAAPAEFPGAIDGPQRWATINTQLLIMSTGLGVGIGYRPWGLSIGATPVYNYTRLSTVRARNPDSGDRLIDESGGLAEGRILFENGEASALSWILGARWQPAPNWALGLSWSSGISYDVEGQVHISFGRAEETHAQARFDLPVPQSLRLELGMDLGTMMTLRPQVTWTEWSVFKKQEAVNIANGEVLLSQERNFSDVISYRLACDLALNDELTLHATGQFENGATPVETFEPGLAESNNWEIGLGASVQLTDSVNLSASFTWQQFVDVDVRNSVQQPTMNGYYTDARQYVTIDLEVSL